MSDFEITEQDEQQFEQVFPRLNPENGKINGQSIRRYSSRLKIDNRVLGQIWSLADTDQDGYIDKRELFIFLKLTRIYLKDIPIPEILPTCLLNYSFKAQRESVDNIENIASAYTLEEIFQLPSNFVPDSYQTNLIDQINKKLEEKKILDQNIENQKATNFKLEKTLQTARNRLSDEQKKFNTSRNEEINLVAKIEKALAEGFV
uniref:EH domain-containing protein 3 (Trinotate prediction) n=1 Tax=Myxobolus squamalis TaxID=59785 RepID=A0A6B2FY51_MYXSQ